jgi:hypothetical protein
MLISLDEPDKWNDVVRRCDAYDIYHLAEYQHVPTPMDTGTAVLAVVEDETSGFFAALPLRLRRVNEIEAIRNSGEFGDDVLDAVSPYGYPGLIVGRTGTGDKSEGEAPAELGAGTTRLPRRFEPGAGTTRLPRRYAPRNDGGSLHPPPSTHHAPPSTLHLSLDALLRKHNVVSAFLRQHPLIDSTSLFAEPFAAEVAGTTVAIDLTMAEPDYIRQTRKSHHADVEAWDARQPTFEEPGHAALRTFAESYRASMRRKGAIERYLFDDAYFENLGRHLGPSCRVFAARVADAPAGRFDAMAIVLTCGSTAQYHLAATSDEKSASGLSRWLLERIRLTLKREGLLTFHLGGGLGAADDSLFRFKSGFSEWRPAFHVVRWVADVATYKRLCTIAGTSDDEKYFPAYRAYHA